MSQKVDQSKVENALDSKTGNASLKRFDLALHKFTDVAIPLHLDLLNKHRDNIRKFKHLQEWDRIHREQVNASRTVQQLKSHIWEVEKVRQQLRTEDLPAFDRRVNPVKTRALDAVHAFIEEHHEVVDPTQLLSASRQITTISENEDKPASSDSNINENDAGIQEQVNNEVVPQTTLASVSSWRKLYNELLGLNHMIHTFHTQVQLQQTSVDSIQENLDVVQMNVQEGATHLGKASKLKAAMLPLTGALIGCVAAGPVGLLAGFKLGGLAAALGGGVIGYQGGRYLKQRREQITEVELQDLSNQNAKGSLSLPDLTNSVEHEERRTLTPSDN